MPPNSRRPAPRALTPDNPVVSYPTPNISDLMVVQDVDTRVPGYVALEYGDLHPDQVTYPGLKLVFQQPLDQDANFMWVRRIYAKDRADQDEYNYAIKFSANDPGYPIYVRTYILPRADYEPLDLGAIDPEYPTATLVNEEVQRIKSNSTSDANEELLDSLFVKVIRIYETIPGPAIGAKRVYNERGDLETVVKQTVDADAAPTADGLLVTAAMVEQEDTSKGIKTTSTVASHSTLRTKKRGNADLIPAKFRAAQVTEATDDIVAPSTAPEVPDGTIVESQVQQTSATKAKKVTVSMTGAVSPLSGKKYTSQGQVASVTESLISTGGVDDSITPSATTIEANIEALGNGKSVKTVAEVGSVFGEQAFSRERPDVTPEKFRALVPAVTESVVAAGTAVAPTLDSGDLSKSEEQITVQKKRTRSTKRTVTTAATLTSKRITPEGQLAQVVETLATGDQTVTPTALTVDGRVEALGNGQTVKTEITVSEVFDRKTLSASKPDVLPANFRASVPTETTVEVQAGTVAAMPTLGAGVLEASEQRVTAHTKRVSKTERDLTSIPTLQGQNYDPQTNTVLKFTEEITDSGEDLGTAAREISPLSEDLDLVRTFDLAQIGTQLNAISMTFPSRTTLNLPPVLKGLSVVWDESDNEGDYSNTYTGSYANVAIRGRANSSASRVPAWVVDLEQVWATNVPTQTYVFFMTNATLGNLLTKLGTIVGGSVQQWPTFKPRSHNLVAWGQSVGVTAEADLNHNWSSNMGLSTVRGKGGSAQVSSQAVVLKLPPCLHGSITVTETNTKSVTATADLKLPFASVTENTTGGYTFTPAGETVVGKTVTGAATGRVSGTLAPTSPSNIPRSGLYLIDSKVEMYKYGYAKVYAEVINAGVFA